MKGMVGKLVAMSMTVCMLTTGLVGCGNSNEKATTGAESVSEKQGNTEVSETNQEPITIRWGTHYLPELDPYYTDAATGEYTMAEAGRQAAIAALEKVKEELNVEIEYIQYAQDPRNELLSSVLAANPVCDLALMWGGSEWTILAQNVLQQLDDYTDMYESEETSWMLFDKTYGHNYFLTSNQVFHQKWPLVYNITMIEQVDALKDENGETIYPTDLYLEGKWTWSVFEEYLSKIQAHYANVPAPDGAVHSNVQAYETDWRFAALSATYAAGGAIYGEKGLAVDSPGSIKATKFIAELKQNGLMTDPGVYDDGYGPVWTRGGEDFTKGATVFTDCPNWFIAGAGSAATERGESIALVPYPRPDEMAMDDENYRQVVTAGDSWGILKGVSEEKTKIALESFNLYWKTYYEVYGNCESVADYKEVASADVAAALGIDIFNEKCGDDVLEVFIQNSQKCVPNDYADLLGLRVTWDNILGKGLYGIEGMPAYDVAIKANMTEFTNIVNDMEIALGTSEIRDNMAPTLTQVSTITLAKGSTADGMDWAPYFEAEDSVDGILDVTTAAYTVGEIDFNTVGKYQGGIEIAISDSSDNKASMKADVIIYNPDNKEAPILQIKSDYPMITANDDLSKVNWGNDFVETATDIDGLDIKANVQADLSSIDATTPGEYDVILTVTDYVGNETSETIKVQVGAAE